MRFEDETLLSAYLDDELGPQDRLRVETALRSDPELATQFRELAEVREILQSLNRPDLDSAPAPDVTEAVLQKLARRREARRSARVLAIRSVLVAAAAVLVALTLAPWSPWARQGPQQPRIAKPETQAAADPELALTESRAGVLKASNTFEEADGLQEALSDVPDLEVKPPTLVDRQPIDPAFLDLERIEVEHRDFLRNLLERPEVLRLVLEIPSGRDPEPVLNTLDDLVGNVVRKQSRYGRIQLDDRLIVDPLRPGEAIVYTLWADPPELKAILDELTNRLQETVTLKEEPVNPEIRTMLAEAGALKVLPGSQGEIYQNPASEKVQALRNPVEGISALPPQGPGAFPRPGTGSNSRALTGIDPDSAPDPQPRTGPSTILIWVEMPSASPKH